MAKILRFRRLKHAPPRKLPVLKDTGNAMSARKFGTLTAMIAVAAFGLAAAFSSGAVSLASLIEALPSSGLDGSCNIKGNVSIGSGERIYHVPGQQDYLSTKISPQYGERWFCTETDALAAGWRPAGR